MQVWLTRIYTRRMSQALTLKQTKFATRIYEGLTQIEAYKASYNAGEMTDPSIAAEAKKLGANPAVRAYVERLEEDAAYVATLSVAWVLKQYMQIATADVNELVELRHVCCRHCYGIDHAYQWRDANEWALRLAEVIELNNVRELANAKALQPKAPEPLPTDEGGYGFWATKEPVSTCPACYGEGSKEYHVHDTRKLKGAAKLLYAGLKPTRDGVQVLTRNQDAALDYLAKYLGIDRKTLELTGPNGGPIKSISVATSDPAEAAKMYAQLMAEGDAK